MSNKTPLSRRDFIAKTLAGGLGLGTLVLSRSAAAQKKPGNRFGTQNIRPQGLRNDGKCAEKNVLPDCLTLGKGSNLPGGNLNTGGRPIRGSGGAAGYSPACPTLGPRGQGRN
ncbi:MAG: twin-arginine translocation signal domain-containing protein [Rhodospirillales bacterium]|nr:twin-arginine translocation signal domain-containing protein [Rhodospirillales bacterium]